jgi:SNF2 family DNA or RNA helicase
VLARTLAIALDLVDTFKKACRSAGCEYDTIRGSHCPPEQTPILLEELESQGFDVELVPDLATELERLATVSRKAAAVAGVRAEILNQRLWTTSKKKVKPYQKVGMQFLASNPRAMLADDCGLGKSLQVLGALGQEPRCLIVAPAIMKGAWVGRGKNRVLRGGWCDEIRRWLGPHVVITVLTGRDSFRWPEPNECVITGYEILPRAPGEVEKKNKLPPLALECPRGVFLVADEAQRLANPTSLQTRRFRNLAFRVLENGGSTWGVTATPLNNNPKELWHVLECFGLASLTFGSFDRYAKLHNCEMKLVKRDSWAWEWGQPEPEVPQYLSRYMLKRKKRDVLEDLPAITFTTLVVELDKKTSGLCDVALNVLDRYEKSGLNLAQAYELLDENAGGSFDFAKISAALEALGRAKAPFAIQQMIEAEGKGEPVVFFAAHVAVVEELALRKGWGAITGGQSTANLNGTPEPMKRGEVIRLFQEGKLEHGVAATIGTMGTGATLTRASHAFFHSRLWSHTKNMQAIGRIERLGQENAMRVTNLSGNHPLDLRMAEVLERKASLYVDSIEAAAVEKKDLAKPKVTVFALDAAARKVIRGPVLRARLDKGT